MVGVNFVALALFCGLVAAARGLIALGDRWLADGGGTGDGTGDSVVSIFYIESWKKIQKEGNDLGTMWKLFRSSIAVIASALSRISSPPRRANMPHQSCHMVSKRYQLLGTLGEGTYGTVVKVRRKHPDNDSEGGGQVFALKQLRRRYEDFHSASALPEMVALRELQRGGSGHPHLVQVHELIREADGSVFFVFEHMPDGNLYDLIQKCAKQKDGRRENPSQKVAEEKVGAGGGLCEQRTRSILRQVLSGLSYMHSRGFFHRDVKPENILLRGGTAKVADLGLAKVSRSCPPYTEYVSTRWYRAPEVLLRAPRYGPPVDAFAVGCIAAELWTLRPLLPGRDEFDQLRRTVEVVGAPTEQSWAVGAALARRLRLSFQDVRVKGRPLRGLVPPAALGLVEGLLEIDPGKRLKTGEALRHAYFEESVIGGGARKRGGKRISSGRECGAQTATPAKSAARKRPLPAPHSVASPPPPPLAELLPREPNIQSGPFEELDREGMHCGHKRKGGFHEWRRPRKDKIEAWGPG